MNTKKIMLSMVVLSSMIPSLSLYGMTPEAKLNYPYVGKFNPSHFVMLSLFAAVFRLYWKEPKTEPKYYDLNNAKKFLQVPFIFSSPQEYWDNVVDFTDNFIIGQYFKDKFMKVKADGTIKQSRKCPPSGVLGWTVSGFGATEKSQKLLKNIFKLVSTVAGFKLIGDGLFNNMALYSIDREKPAAGRFTPYEEAQLQVQKEMVTEQNRNAVALENFGGVLKDIFKQYQITLNSNTNNAPSAPRDSQQPLYPQLPQTSNNSNNQQQPSTTPQSNITERIETHTITVTQ